MKIVITSLAIALSLSANAQNIVKPPMQPPPAVELQLPDAPSPPPVPNIPPLPKAASAPEATQVPTTNELNDDYKLFLKKNPMIRSLSWTKTAVIVRLKNGKEERYTINDENSMRQAINKYGELPVAPPPPPVAPPLPPLAPPPPPKEPRKNGNI